MKKLSLKTKIIKALGSSLYVTFNLMLIVAILLSINVFNSLILAFGLIVFAKWRIFAVKPRFWLANIKAAVVDFTIGFSYVLTIYSLGYQNLIIQVVISVLYIIWLLIIKSRTSQQAMAIQSLIAIFWFNLIISYFLSVIPLLVLMVLELIIGYFAVWHYLTNFDFGLKTKRLISGFWGLVLVELSWISWHYLIGYGQSVLPLTVSQMSIISLLLTYFLFTVLEFSYRDQIKKQQTFKQILPSIIFVVGLILTIVLFFSKNN